MKIIFVEARIHFDVLLLKLKWKAIQYKASDLPYSLIFALACMISYRCRLYLSSISVCVCVCVYVVLFLQQLFLYSHFLLHSLTHSNAPSFFIHFSICLLQNQCYCASTLFFPLPLLLLCLCIQFGRACMLFNSQQFSTHLYNRYIYRIRIHLHVYIYFYFIWNVCTICCIVSGFKCFWLGIFCYNLYTYSVAHSHFHIFIKT